MKKLVLIFFAGRSVGESVLRYPAKGSVSQVFSDRQILSENRILGYFRFLIDLLEYPNPIMIPTRLILLRTA